MPWVAPAAWPVATQQGQQDPGETSEDQDDAHDVQAQAVEGAGGQCERQDHATTMSAIPAFLVMCGGFSWVCRPRRQGADGLGLGCQ